MLRSGARYPSLLVADDRLRHRQLDAAVAGVVPAVGGQLDLARPTRACRATPRSRRAPAATRGSSAARFATVGPKSSPPLARKSVVPMMSLASSAIGLPSSRRSSTAMVPPSQCDTRANARDREDALVVREIAREQILERARRQRQRRQAIVERQRFEERAIGQLARRQVGTQPAAVGQPDVGVRGAADLVGDEIAQRRLGAIGTPEHRRQRHADLARLHLVHFRQIRRDRRRDDRDRARRPGSRARAHARRSVPSAGPCHRPRARAWRTRARCRTPARAECR